MPCTPTRGLATPLLLSRNTDGRGVGHTTNDQWWLHAFDQKLKGLDTSRRDRHPDGDGRQARCRIDSEGQIFRSLRRIRQRWRDRGHNHTGYRGRGHRCHTYEPGPGDGSGAQERREDGVERGEKGKARRNGLGKPRGTREGLQEPTRSVRRPRRAAKEEQPSKRQKKPPRLARRKNNGRPEGQRGGLERRRREGEEEDRRKRRADRTRSAVS